jgi:hypothetical protein
MFLKAEWTTNFKVFIFAWELIDHHSSLISAPLKVNNNNNNNKYGNFREMYLLYYQILQLSYKLLYNVTFSKTPLGSGRTPK